MTELKPNVKELTIHDKITAKEKTLEKSRKILNIVYNIQLNDHVKRHWHSHVFLFPWTLSKKTKQTLIPYLVIWTNRFLAFFTIMCEKFLVARYTVRVLFLEDIAASDQLLVAVLASQMILVVIWIHRFCILGRKYQLKI